MIRALAVDSDPIFLKILTAMATQVPNIELLTVQCSSQAFKLLGQGKFSLLIANRRLPGISGCELVTIAKNFGLVERAIMLTDDTSCQDCPCQHHPRLHKQFRSCEALRSALQTAMLQ